MPLVDDGHGGNVLRFFVTEWHKIGRPLGL